VNRFCFNSLGIKNEEKRIYIPTVIISIVNLYFASAC
jgi:hypothetical protein